MFKKIIIMSLIAVTSFGADLSWTNINAMVPNKAAILALLPDAQNLSESNRVYRGAINCIPNGSARLAYVQTLEGKVPELDYVGYLIAALPAGTNRNAQVVKFFELGGQNGGTSKSFTPGFATRAETIAYYDLVMRALQLTDTSRPWLQKIKGDREKLLNNTTAE